MLLYFSCYEIKDKRGRLYFAAKNTVTKLLASTAIPASFFNEQMDFCRAQTQILLLDCAYSGAFIRDNNRGDMQTNTQAIFGTRKVIMTSSDAMQYSFEHETIEGYGIDSYFKVPLSRLWKQEAQIMHPMIHLIQGTI